MADNRELLETILASKESAVYLTPAQAEDFTAYLQKQGITNIKAWATGKSKWTTGFGQKRILDRSFWG
jgi:hypothetical protein